MLIFRIVIPTENEIEIREGQRKTVSKKLFPGYVFVQMVMDDKADLMVADMTQCILAVMRFPEAGLTTLDKPLTVEPIGIAVSKEDAQFFNLVDNLLRAYEKTGVLNQLRTKWFEESAWIAAMP